MTICADCTECIDSNGNAYPMSHGAAQRVAIVCDMSASNTTGDGGFDTTDFEMVLLCDDNQMFIAIPNVETDPPTLDFYETDNGGNLVPYVPVGTIDACQNDVTLDADELNIDFPCGVIHIGEVCYECPPVIVELVNAGFEEPVTGAAVTFVPEGGVPGWNTDGNNDIIEFWRGAGVPTDGPPGPFEGDQYVEINYIENARLWQVISGLPEEAVLINWHWAHASRGNPLSAGVDETARMTLGEAGTDPNTHFTVTTSIQPGDAKEWVEYEGQWLKPAGLTDLEVSLWSDTPTGAVGNLVDDVRISYEPLGVCRAAVMWDCESESCRYWDIESCEEVFDIEIVNCGTPFDTEQEILCDTLNDNHQFIRVYNYNQDGIIVTQYDVELDGETPYGAFDAGSGVRKCDCGQPIGDFCFIPDPDSILFNPIAETESTDWVVDSPTEAHKTLPNGNTILAVITNNGGINGRFTNGNCVGAFDPFGLRVQTDGAGTVEAIFTMPPGIYDSLTARITDLDFFPGGGDTEGFRSTSHGQPDAIPVEFDQPGGPGTTILGATNNSTGDLTWSGGNRGGTFVAEFDVGNPGGSCLMFNFTSAAEPSCREGYRIRNCETGEVTYFDSELNEEIDMSEDSASQFCDCDEGIDSEYHIVCDNTGPFLRQYQTNKNGEMVGVNNLELDGVTDHAVTGQVFDCEYDIEVEVLCDRDDNGPGIDTSHFPFLRTYLFEKNGGALAGFRDTTFDGNTPYVPDGTAIVKCPNIDHEQQILCDTGADNEKVLVHYLYADHVLTSIYATNMNGTQHVIFGPLVECPDVDECGQPLGEICYECESVDIELINGSFEEPIVGPGTVLVTNENNVPGWNTDSPSNNMELWRTGFTTQLGEVVTAFDGNQMTEIDASVNNIWQVVSGLPEEAVLINWHWAHKARSLPNETVQMQLGDPNTPVATHFVATTSVKQPLEDWTAYEGQWLKPAGLTELRISLSSLSPTFGSSGNIVDDIRLSYEPSNICRAAVVRDCETEELFFIDIETGEVVVDPVILDCPLPLDTEQEILCDTLNDNHQFIRVYNYNATGIIQTQYDIEFNGDPYGAFNDGAGVVKCPNIDQEVIVLCDDNGPFLRSNSYNPDNGELVVSVDTELDGTTPYIPIGTVETCNRDTEQQILCDEDGTVFLRHYHYNESNTIVAVVNTELNGVVPFVPVGNASTCDCGQSLGGFCYLPDPDSILLNPLGDSNSVPWIVDSPTTAHKDLPNGNTILAQKISGNADFQTFNGSLPGGAQDPNALLLTPTDAAGTIVEFTMPPGIYDTLTVELTDLDKTPGRNETFWSSSHGQPDIISGNLEQPGGTGTVIRGAANNSVGQLTWNTGNQGGTFLAEFTATGGTGALQFDFLSSGSSDCRDGFIERDCRTGELTYIDKELGVEVDMSDQSGNTFCDCERAIDSEYLILCDENGPFLRRYQTNKDGELVGTDNFELDGVTPYAVEGQVFDCEFDTEIEVLCDDDVQFLRQYFYQTNGGALAGILDTELDGQTPYVPVGAVVVCPKIVTETIVCADNRTAIRRVTEDSNGNQTVQFIGVDGTIVTPVTWIPGYCTDICGTDNNGASGTPVTTDESTGLYLRAGVQPIEPAGSVQTFWDGNPLTVGPDTPPPANVLRGGAATLQAARPDCDSGDVTVTWDFTFTNGPVQGSGYHFSARISNKASGTPIQVTSVAAPSNCPANFVLNASLTALVPAQDLANGDIVLDFDGDTYQTNGKTWTVSDHVTTFEYSQEGCNTPPVSSLLVKMCSPIELAQEFVDDEIQVLCDDNNSFLRHYRYTQSGDIMVVDTRLDGITPYVVEGDIRECTATTSYQILPVCFIVNAAPLAIHTAYKVIDVASSTTTTQYYYESDTGTIHQPEDVTEVECIDERDPLTVCDDNGPFIQHLVYGSYGNILATQYTLIDGVTPYTPVGDIHLCECCPEQICYTVPEAEQTECDDPTIQQIQGTNDSTFTSVLPFANPDAYTIDQTQLNRTIDGSVSGNPVIFIITGVVNNPRTNSNVEIDYNFAVPRNAVRVIRLYNNHGSVLNDADGISAVDVTLLDSGNAVLFNGPLPLPGFGNGAAPFDLLLPSIFDDVAVVRLSNITSNVGGAGGIGWRELQVFSQYQSEITFDCGGDITTIDVAGDNAGLSISGGNQLTQTNGPHTLTFNMPVGSSGNIITNNPAAFSTLAVTNGTVVTLTGNGTLDFELETFTGSNSTIELGTVTYDPITNEPIIRDANTGEIVPNAIVVPCVLLENQEGDTNDSEFQVLCDISPEGISTPFLRHYNVVNGMVLVTDTLLDGLTSYIATGTVANCANSSDIEQQILCDDNGKFIRHYVYDSLGNIATYNTELDGTTEYVITGTVVVCPQDYVDVETFVLCDDNGPFIRTYYYDEDGVLINTQDTLLDSTTPYIPIGTTETCFRDAEVIILCDDNGPFLRHLFYNESNTIIAVTNTNLSGFVPYVPVGTVTICATGGGGGTDLDDTNDDIDGELLILCDDNGPFLRHFLYDELGAISSVVDTELDGTTGYVTVGTVLLCTTETMVVSSNITAHRVVLSGIGTWTMPATNVQSISIVVVNVDDDNNPPTITTSEPATPLFEGESASWGITDNQDTQIVPPFEIETFETDDVIIINWTEN